MTPRRLREFVLRAIGADRVLWVDPAERAGYEVRAARSEPAVQPAGEPRELSQSRH